MKFIKIFLLSLTFIFILSFLNKKQDLTYFMLQKHVRYLASDKLNGRFPLTQGDYLARNYIDSVYQSLGLTDLTHDHFQQKFDYLQNIKPQYKFEICIENKSIILERKRDFVISPESGDGTINNTKALFVGYGDSLFLKRIKKYFKNTIIIGYLFPPKTADRKLLKKYSWINLIKQSELYGAKGILFVAPENKLERLRSLESRYPYSQRIKRHKIPLLTISRTMLKKILKFNHLNLDSLEKIIKDKEGHFFKELSKTSFNLNIRIKFVYKKAANLVGLLKATITGKKEIILIGAHYDHLLPKKKKGLQDSVRNGADDNASGVAMLLELARTFSKQHKRKFDMILVSFGAEESGMIGSDYFVKHPIIDLKKIKLMINLDMVGRMRKNTVYIKCNPGNLLIQNQLKKIKSSELTLAINKIDALTDAFPFYKRHIQTIWITTGFHQDQHQVTDEVDKINFKGMVKIHEFIDQFLNSLTENKMKL